MIDGRRAGGQNLVLWLALAIGLLGSGRALSEPAADPAPADGGVLDGQSGDGVPSPADPPTLAPGIQEAPARAAIQTPAPPPAADPVLVQLRDDLRALSSGHTIPDLQVERLFITPLDDLESLRARVRSLPEEIAQLEASLKKLNAAIASPEKNFPEAPPEAPPPLPEMPVAPQVPTVDEPGPANAPPNEAEQARHEEHSRIWSEYRAAVQKYEQALLDWKQQAALDAQARERYEGAREAHAARREAWLTQRRKELLDTELHLDISRLRLSMLDLLIGRLGNISKPAIQAMQSIASSRIALRAFVAKIAGLTPTIEKLNGRLDTLANRLSSGALVGFAAEREVLEPRIASLREQCRSLLTRTRDEVAEFESLAQAQEGDGRRFRQIILQDILNGPPDQEIDSLFSSHLENLRRLTRRVDRLPAATFAPLESQQALGESLADPKQLGTITEAEQALDQVAGQLEDLNRGLQLAHLDLDRWRLAFEREQNTLLAALASAEARTKAYSLSSELLSDLRTDLVLVWGLIRGWATEKWEDLKALPEWATSTAGTLWLMRLVLAVILLVFVIKTRHRASAGALWLVRRARSVRSLQRRVGALIRWAGLLQAILPTLAMWIGGYLSLLLIGFDHTEIRFIEVAFFWLMLYALGRQLLVGLTRQISRGRPALVPTSPATANLLRMTYGRMGLFFALVAIVEKWSRVWMGAGTLGALLRWAIWLWFFAWGLWAAFAWRLTLGRALQKDRPPESSIHIFGRLMSDHWYSAFLSPIALILVLGLGFVRMMRRMLDAGGFFAFLRARTLRRLSKKDAEAQAERPPDELPEEYRREFPLYPILGEEGPVLIPRENLLEQIRTPILEWRNTRKEGSLVLVGEKGIGKTTLLALLSRRLDGLPVLQHSIQGKIVTAADLLADLAPALGQPDADSLDSLADALMAGEERVVLLDEAHNLFLRKVDGYRAFDALVRLVTHSSQQVYWVLAFNSFAWEFINQSRKRVHYFRRLLKLPDWSTEALADLVTRRNKRSGVQIVFDEVILDEGRSRSGDLELIENTEGYFRLLRDSSAGNPRVATYLWLRSLRAQPDGSLKLGLFRDETAAEIEKLDRELLFALAAYCEHENLTPSELREVLNISDDFASFAVRFLLEYGYLELKSGTEDRATLGPRFYRQVLQVLRKRHLVFEGE